MVYLRYLIMANKPRIRFRGFTEDWEQCKLGDLYKRVNERNDGTLGRDKWISVAKMYFQDPDKVQSNNLDTRTYVMKKGDIAFEGHPNNEFKFGRFVLNDIGTGIISELFPIYRPITEYDLDFWKYAIQLERVMAPIFAKSITSSGNSSNKLDHNHFLNQELLVPNIEEQKKIGTLLSLLSKNITLHQHKLKKLNLAKKALLQKLFPRNGSQFPVVRFKGFTDAWEQRKLDDIVKIKTGGGTPKTTNPEYWSGDIPWIQSSDLVEGDIVHVNINKYINDRALKNSAAKLISRDSIALVTRVGVGKVAVINQDFTTSQDFLSLSNFDGNDIKFFAYQLYRLMQENAKILQGTSIKGITKTDLIEQSIVIPSSIQEQNLIANVLSKIDSIITLHQRKLEKLQEVKKGLLQKMFV